LVSSLEIGDGFYDPLFSPGLRYAAVLPLLRDPDAVFIWDGASGQARGPIFESRLVGSFTFSPDSALLAVVVLARRIELWDVATQRIVERSFAPAATELGRPVFSPDGRWLAAPDGDDILLWETALGGEPRRLQGHNDHVNCLAFAGSEPSLFSGGSDNRLLQWDLQSGQPERSLEGLRTDVMALATSPDGSLLISGSQSVEYDQQGENPAYEHKPIRIWQADTGELLRGFDYADVISLEFGPEGEWIAAQLTIDPGLIDVQTGHHLQSLPNEGSPFVTNVAVHPSGRLLALGVGQEILMWDVAAGQEVLRLTGNQNQVYRVEFSPDGRYLAASGVDGVARVWEVEGK
jgi:WD40 repeat protein